MVRPASRLFSRRWDGLLSQERVEVLQSGRLLQSPENASEYGVYLRFWRRRTDQRDMGIFELFLLAVGSAPWTVPCRVGVQGAVRRTGHPWWPALTAGPGGLLGCSRLQSLISSIDHWIAFQLRPHRSEHDPGVPQPGGGEPGTSLPPGHASLAVATSIDALLWASPSPFSKWTFSWRSA